MQQNSEVDVNVLVNLYNSRLASALNQNDKNKTGGSIYNDMI